MRTIWPRRVIPVVWHLLVGWDLGGLWLHCTMIAPIRTKFEMGHCLQDPIEELGLSLPRTYDREGLQCTNHL